MSPFRKTELSHLCFFIEFEATYFVILLICGHPSVCLGQYEANISKVFLPRRRSYFPAISFAINFPKKSKKKGALPPPYLKSPEVSSSGPPGACITPSSVIKVNTIIFLIIFLNNNFEKGYYTSKH